MSIWRRQFARAAVLPATSYADYLGAEHLRIAVHEFDLAGETYFKQFRGMHQIPELLGAEACDHLESAVKEIRREHLAGAACRVRLVGRLVSVATTALRPLIANLDIGEYHKIRQNLGRTSGSHSATLSFELFRDLYTQLGEEVCRCACGDCRVKSPIEWEALLTAAFELRSRVRLWRDLHIGLTRNVLGGEQTKSLAGSSDALAAVCAMRNRSEEYDALRNLATLVGLEREPLRERSGRVTSPQADALDDRILAATGFLTKERFKDVQERSGHFEAPTVFSRPALRKVRFDE
jgi:tryptophan 2,3-dioxygenase